MNLFDLMPPHSIEAEQCVLGGLMLDNEAWELIADIIGPDDFFKHEHRLIFKAIQTLAAATKPFDVVTVSESLAKIDEAGGLAYLAELAKNVPSVANISAYAEIVRERAHLRQLIMLGHECSRNASSDQAKSLEIQESFEQKLFALGQGRAPNSFVNVNDALMKVLEQVDFNFNHGDGVTGVPSGLADLDQKTGGFQDADLIIVAARPSMGKTSLALNFVDAVLQKRPTGSVQIYSLEMPAQALMYRMLAILGQLDLANLMRGQLEDEDWPRLTAAVARINAYGERLVVDDSSDLTPATLRARARRAARRYGKPSLIMVDYLQLMQCPGKENRNLEIAAISAGLKALAKEFDCPVVALSQLNRSLENRPNKRPHNGDLRESGALEQDADLTLFIYRDEVYHPDSVDQGIAELIIGKHRNGPTGVVRTAFIPAHTRFANLDAKHWQGAAK
ncbi:MULTISPECIES: replicative DNA helicase [unclassified Pseudomonas]|uniref:replicative DNA helicase n=1 Tax=unclassified Pseudomonas TaxID=196821 RepID=UPI002B22AF4B|nr:MULTISPECIES: replicative DNA helicase [unclassified Pseudomonas]MEA9976513.1 replicative DNA helicase [Pseudomonas sp. RTS4]MEB0198351.1 replicative DNA helicase [Pseudomonas sp. 5S4]MEB0244066.1 replicative DNA helicase [Pseudomonas sp. 10S5]